ncbi:aspartic proteinase asp1 [Phtheirospermum japonicum]|uniref:Aspartic proteinase asp1 n=1 Tax=Phtheirospermum japonicum TaxID=374723 RepID=A0A830BE55_9LAMI|nr:aspartic proteinase asp1 [Phtheirospermum japonicum]
MKPKGANFFFPLDGNVYPRGYYTAKISIGRPPKAYVLDIDTGSDLTWLTCTAHHYDAHQGTLVNCGDPECAALGALWMNKGICNTPPINQYPCQYKINYADGTYYTGVLVKDFVHLKLSNGRWVRPWLAFGEHYSLGSANILLGGEATDIKRLNIIFDSGSTYTYLNSMAYEALLDLITRNVNTKLTRAYDDNDLPICWRGPFPSFDHVRPYFLPLALSFTDDKYAQFPMGVESYLIISAKEEGAALNGEYGSEIAIAIWV